MEKRKSKKNLRMTFVSNLKNRSFKNAPCKLDPACYEIYEKWFEDLKKELRERLKDAPKDYIECCRANIINLLMEILGE